MAITETLINSDKNSARAIVVGVCLSAEEREKLDDDLTELESLLSTLGVTSVGRVIQQRARYSPQSLIGSGKIEEISDLAQAKSAGLIVSDHALSGPQVRNIEEATKCQVLDRQGIILDIFAKHARTNTAKTQVEIARLEYLLPRLTGAWTHFGRQTGGGVRARGMGEKQIEVDRRRAKERITRLKAQLKHIEREKATQRKARHNELKVALVGYTNSGKTTLMKGLTRAAIEGKDELFATLDSNIKTIDPNTRPKILLSDTVGFIQNLPHALVESFKSTLDEVIEADLLLHVVDISHDRYREQMQTTIDVLQDIGAAEIPTLVVFNKTDQIDDPILPKVLKSAYPGSRCVSAQDQENLRNLREHIYEFFLQNFIEATLKIRHDDHQGLRIIHRNCMILTTPTKTESSFRSEQHGKRSLFCSHTY